MRRSYSGPLQATCWAAGRILKDTHNAMPNLYRRTVNRPNPWITVSWVVLSSIIFFFLAAKTPDVHEMLLDWGKFETGSAADVGLTVSTCCSRVGVLLFPALMVFGLCQKRHRFSHVVSRCAMIVAFVLVVGNCFLILPNFVSRRR